MTRMDIYQVIVLLCLQSGVAVLSESASKEVAAPSEEEENALYNVNVRLAPLLNKAESPIVIHKRVKRWDSTTDLSDEELDELFSDFGINRHQRRRPAKSKSSTEHPHHHHHHHHGESDVVQHNHREHHRGRSKNRNRNGGRSRTGRRKDKSRRRNSDENHDAGSPESATLPLSFDELTTTTVAPSGGTVTDPLEKAMVRDGGIDNWNRATRPSRRLGTAIPSGQNIRLRGGHNFYEGRVEVYHHGRWGLICDDDWELTDANVVCKQLGFTKGAVSALGGAAFGTEDYRSGDIIMDEVECNGAESRIQDCVHATIHDCLVSEVASVVCTPNDGCESGWVSGLGLCYRLMPQMATFETAHTKCSQLNAHLLTIENQEESDFISDWLMSNTDETNFYTAGHKVTEDGLEYWKWHGTLYTIGFTKWFQGWPPHATMRQPSNHTGQNCLTLARMFYNQRMRLRDVNYFFWNDAPCTVQLPFVCEKLAENQDCYEDNGMDYRGEVYRTEMGTLCQKWTVSDKINRFTHPYKGLGDHNFCRNPDGDLRPWCWVNAATGSFGFCNVEQCVAETTVATTEMMETTENPEITTEDLNITLSDSSTEDDNVTLTTETPIVTTEEPCGQRMFPCADIFEASGFRCIPAVWQCDGEEDCYHGDDEVGCDGEEEQSTPPETTTTTMVVEVTTTPPLTTLEPTCAHGLFMCGNGLCLPVVWLCDGDQDCSDGEDEANCPTELSQLHKVSYHRLVADNITGHQEVTYAQSSLQQCAQLCLNERSFVCRSFNYKRGDDECTLTELNANMTGGLLQDIHYNYFEIIIQTENCTARSNLFLCDNGKCVEHSDVCNGVDNCNDFSDEHHCVDIEVELRLIGGSSEHEGRVEVQYLGEWGVICDDNWDIEDAHVVCRQLGYRGARRASVMSEFGYGRANFLLDEVECNGVETNIEQCAHNPWRSHDCMTYETAGVVCMVGKVCNEDEFQCSDGSCITATSVCDETQDCHDNSDEEACNDIQVELVGGLSESEGRVEVIVNGKRGTVCDDNWDMNDATVVCRMLGYPQASMVASFGNGSGVIWMDNVHCVGTENSLAECPFNGWAWQNCEHWEDIGVVCSTTSAPQTTTMMSNHPPTVEPVTVPSPPAPTCGLRPIRQPRARIVGGFSALYGAFPWQVSIQKAGLFGGFSHHCGGTIVDEQWIASAAHCFTHITKHQIRVVVGDHNLYNYDIYEQVYLVEDIISHLSYGRSTHDNDMALIKLQGRIRFNNHVQPACLPDEDAPEEYQAGTQCLISGWGKTGSGSTSYLKAASVPLLSWTSCRHIYKYSMSERMICAGYLEGGVDTCQGDSGGPLVCRINGSYTLLGITSWGHGCGEPNSPGVYANVQKFLIWIKHKMLQYS